MRGPFIAGVLLAFVGLVWMAQGLGVIGGSSFMVNDLRWAVLGTALVAAGVILLLVARRRLRSPGPPGPPSPPGPEG
jgi:membrane protein implicated in regulation of membrane protease activity